MSRKPGYVRCLNRTNGVQCDEWYQDNGSKYCQLHSELGIKYVDTVNDQRKYCYQMFADIEHPTLEEFSILDAHLERLIEELERQKTLISATKAVRGELTEHLSEAERQKRLQYKVKKQDSEPREKKAKKPKESKKTPTLAKDPLAFFAKKGISAKNATELLNADPEELIKKFQERKNARLSKEKTDSPLAS